MTQDLLVYLESRAVLHQGLINKKDLTPSDRKQIEMWMNQGLMECTPLKPPSNVSEPMFTHKIRLSETLYMKAWQNRLDKAEQFTPRIRHQSSDGTIPPEFNLPKVSMYLLTIENRHSELDSESPNVDKDVSSNKALHNSPSSSQERGPGGEVDLWTEFQQWLNQKGATLMPEQKAIAQKLFKVYNHPRHKAFINMKGTGHSWLLMSIDQFFTYRCKEDSPLEGSPP